MEKLCFCGKKMVGEVNEDLNHIKFECECGSWGYQNYFPNEKAEQDAQGNSEAYWRERALYWEKEAQRLSTERDEILRMYNRMNNGIT